MTVSPLDIIRRRYARGEITREQFEQLKRHLGLDGPGHEAGHPVHAHDAAR